MTKELEEPEDEEYMSSGWWAENSVDYNRWVDSVYEEQARILAEEYEESLAAAKLKPWSEEETRAFLIKQGLIKDEN